MKHARLLSLAAAPVIFLGQCAPDGCAPAAAPAPPACHASYSGECVPITSDVDCVGGSGDGPAYVGLVRVVGPDEYDLDRNGDGWGCESS